jgi:hypothetical protein
LQREISFGSTGQFVLQLEMVAIADSFSLTVLMMTGIRLRELGLLRQEMSVHGATVMLRRE